MAISNDNVISVLNNLIETCKDGQEGFKQAAENVKNSSLRSLFHEYSMQRAQFVGELQDEVRHLGGDPENTGSFAGTLHRGWMNIKTAISTQDDAAILAECERGEDSAVGAYQDALEEALPSNVSEVVNRQFSAIRQAHNNIRNLRDQAKTIASGQRFA